MSTILGLDLSLTSTGWCVLEVLDIFNKAAIIDKGTIKPKVKKTERLSYIKDNVDNLLMQMQTKQALDLVVLEGYSMGSRTGQAFSIGELGGIIRLTLLLNKIKTLIISPTSLKKFVTGKGNAPKDIMMMKALAKYGIEFTDNNICDAYCLAKMGQAYLNGTDIKYEQEAIKKVEVLT
jgi:Holliday junction resolvasome RuvABC endonuclease subunit